MLKHDYIKIRGYVTVKVDLVDLEQVGIDQPGIANDQNHVKAFAAAQQKEGFKSMQRTLMQSGSTLDGDDYQHAGGGGFEVTFIIRDMLPAEQEAAA
jgi:hypothetical protein